MNTKAQAAKGWKKLDTASWIAEGGIDPFSMLSKDWAIIGAGTAQDWNALTASWGGLGHLWNRDVAFCFVRPSRHTFKYAERSSLITLSFFDESRRDALLYFGSRSGRDGDKAAGGGLTPIVFEDGSISFEEARLVLVCRKLYAQKFTPDCVIDPAIAENYPQGDWHTMYVGQIETVRMPSE